MTLHAKMTMPDSQWYPQNLYLIKNVEDKVGFLTRSVDFYEFLYCVLKARYAQVTFTEKSIRLPSLHGGSLEVTFTVPLITLFNQKKHSCVDFWILLFHWLITIPFLIQNDNWGKCPFWKYRLMYIWENSPPSDVKENHGTNGA